MNYQQEDFSNGFWFVLTRFLLGLNEILLVSMGFYWDRVFLLGLFWDAKGFLPGCMGEFYLDFDWDAKGFLPGWKGYFY